MMTTIEPDERIALLRGQIAKIQNNLETASLWLDNPQYRADAVELISAVRPQLELLKKFASQLKREGK